MNDASKSKRTAWAVASFIIVLAVPFVVHGAFWLAHTISYDGTCGPHAPDIAAHPCTRATFQAEFGAGFAGVGLLIIEAAAFVVTSIVVTTAWLIAPKR